MDHLGWCTRWSMRYDDRRLWCRTSHTCRIAADLLSQQLPLCRHRYRRDSRMSIARARHHAWVTCTRRRHRVAATFATSHSIHEDRPRRPPGNRRVRALLGTPSRPAARLLLQVLLGTSLATRIKAPVAVKVTRTVADSPPCYSPPNHRSEAAIGTVQAAVVVTLPEDQSLSSLPNDSRRLAPSIRLTAP